MRDGRSDIEEGGEIINRWWRLVRPYWHIATFLIIASALVTVNWTKVTQYDSRLIALELWRIESSVKQNQQGQDIAVVKQQVQDIHEYLMPKK